MDSSPTTLYKYFAPDRIDVLTNGLIRYSPLGAFNDPFEGRPEITSLTTETSARDALSALLPQEAKNSYERLPHHFRAVFTYDMWEKQLTQHMKANEPELLKLFDNLTPLVRNLLPQKLDECLGAFCLSEVPDSLLMWSHYGASHAGFVIAFDARHSYFHEEKSPNDELRHLRRVEYREARPSATLTEFDGTDVFLVKSGHWSYEREWRIFRALSEADTIYPGDPFATHLFRYPPSAIQAVILGARSSAQTAQAIAAAIQSHSSLSHVRLKRARPDESHFLLHIEAVI